MSPPTPRPTFLTDERLSLIIVGGKGGVGKTTTATATALHLAATRPSARVRLVSTDPAHSVADCLGDAPAGMPANLAVVELDAGREHRAFMDAHRGDLAEIASRGTFLDRADIDGFLELSLPGLDELMAFLRIAEWVESGAQDVLVVDTAPTGHTLRLLQMPDLLARWLEAMDALMAKHRYMADLFGSAGPRGAGHAGADPAERFLTSLRETFELAAALFADPARTRFVPVMLAEALSIAETDDLLAQLTALGVPSGECVVNRLIPASAAGVLGVVRGHQLGLIAGLPERFAPQRLWGLAMLGAEPTGPAALAGVIAGIIEPEELARQVARRESVNLIDPPEPAVEGRVMLLPPAPLSLLILAGKGGVGKTTMACAAAARLAAFDAAESARTLVVSTDPAHSLADALATPLESRPREVAPGLWAMELDAAAEFETLARDYRDEVEQFLDRALGGLDLAFDRQVLERLLDLAPPGLDEIMAVVKVIELTQAGAHEPPTDHAGAPRSSSPAGPRPRVARSATAARALAAARAARAPHGERADAGPLSIAGSGTPGAPFRRLVLDTAPTGHMLRLLQLPGLIERWLQGIFAVLLKHRGLVTLPRLEARLVQLSRGVKRLRHLLTDRDACAVLPVAIPTRLALAETRDLVLACQHAGLRVAGLVVNQALAPSQAQRAGALGAALHAGEARVIAELAAAWPSLPRVVVHRRQAPRGIDAITRLGEQTFDAASDADAALPALPAERAA